MIFFQSLKYPMLTCLIFLRIKNLPLFYKRIGYWLYWYKILSLKLHPCDLIRNLLQIYWVIMPFALTRYASVELVVLSLFHIDGEYVAPLPILINYLVRLPINFIQKMNCTHTTWFYWFNCEKIFIINSTLISNNYLRVPISCNNECWVPSSVYIKMLH